MYQIKKHIIRSLERAKEGTLTEFHMVVHDTIFGHGKEGQDPLNQAISLKILRFQQNHRADFLLQAVKNQSKFTLMIRFSIFVIHFFRCCTSASMETFAFAQTFMQSTLHAHFLLCTQFASFFTLVCTRFARFSRAYSYKNSSVYIQNELFSGGFIIFLKP